MFLRAWARALCLLPILLLLSPGQTAYAASAASPSYGRATVPTGIGQAGPSPTPTPGAPDQSQPVARPSATAPTTTGSPTPTTSGQQSASLSNASGLRREVFGYATAGSLGDPTIGYPSWNFDALSTVAFFAIKVRYDGQLVGDSNFTVWASTTLTGLVSTAHAHGTKVVVTITGPSNPVDMCDALFNDQTTISQLMNQVQAKGVDGVNIDYEGQLRACQNVNDPTLNGMSDQALLTRFAKDMRAALDAIKPGYYLSIATYSGSALGNDGFFNIPDLNQYVDSFFVMAYDMDYANQPYAPLNCSSFCFAPVSPLANYNWNDTSSMTQYSAVVGAGKTILGQPYYGRVACVASPADHAKATGIVYAATYTGAAAVSGAPDVQPGTFSTHRDATDPNGLDRWDSWYDNTYHCWREMHWSDATTLGVRYNLVNQMQLRGVGLWTLNYGGGSPELWSALQTYFTGCYSVGAVAAPSSPVLAGTAVSITASAGCPDPNPQYEFWVLAPGATSFQLAQAYSTNASLAWNTGGLFPGTYRFAIWARDAGSTGEFGNTLGRWDAYNNGTLYTVTTKPCSAVGTAPSPATPAAVGALVTITAHATGCPNPLYQFWIQAPGAGGYTVAQAYSTSAGLSWNTTGKAPGVYHISTWVRDTSSPGTYGNSLGRWDAYSNGSYALTSCSSLSVSVAPPSPAGVGTGVTLTAHASGCAGPLYQFWLLAPGASSYTLAQAYSSNGIYSWNTTNLSPGIYHISVWTRDSNSGGAFSNGLGSWDAYNTNQYTLTSCPSLSVTSAPPATTTIGTPVTFTAKGSCPDPNPVYEFWILAPGASGYTLAQAYSTAASLIWSTAGKAAGTYTVSVWVRDANSAGAFTNGSGTWDVYNSSLYTLH